MKPVALRRSLLHLGLFSMCAAMGVASPPPAVTESEAHSIAAQAFGIEPEAYECKLSLEDTARPSYTFRRVGTSHGPERITVSAAFPRVSGYSMDPAEDPGASPVDAAGAMEIAKQEARRWMTPDEIAGCEWRISEWQSDPETHVVATIQQAVGDPPRYRLRPECDVDVRASDGAVTRVDVYLPLNVEPIPAEVTRGEAIQIAMDACGDPDATVVGEPRIEQTQEWGKAPRLLWEVVLAGAARESPQLIGTMVGDDGEEYQLYNDPPRPYYAYNIDAVSGDAMPAPGLAPEAGGTPPPSTPRAPAPGHQPAATDPEPAGMQPLTIAGIGVGVIALLALGALVWRRRSGS
ncbi:MAG: hypothetical protein GF320_07280 [Armatimonadia bacterium]|nr:hypothetical protein [Armatimonadia bacterium]